MKGNRVYVVCCYQTVFGVYESMEEARQVADDLIAENHPVDFFATIIM